MTKNVVSANYYLLTAGHCAGMNASWFHDEVKVGTVVRRVYFDGATADVEGISRPGTAGHKNWVFVTAGEPSRTVTAREGHNSDTVGESVCISGIVSGFRCGTITVLDWDNVWDGAIHNNNLRSASYTASSGDSGAPIFYGHKAIGIHKAHLGSIYFYSHIWEVEQTLGVVVLTAPT